MSSIKDSSNDSYESSCPYVLAIIYSNWPLSTINEFLASSDSSDGYGLLKIDYRKGKETNRTICLMSSKFYQQLLAEGYNKRRYNFDFAVSQYQLRQHNYPSEGESSNLFVPLPKEMLASECRRYLEEKLSEMCSFGLLNDDDYKLNIPTSSRQSDLHKGSAFLTFKKEVNVDVIASVKILLHDSVWNMETEQKELAQCYWAKDRKKEKVSKPKTVVQKLPPVQVPTKTVYTPVVSESVDNAWKKPLLVNTNETSTNSS